MPCVDDDDDDDDAVMQMSGMPCRRRRSLNGSTNISSR